MTTDITDAIDDTIRLGFVCVQNAVSSSARRALHAAREVVA
jgi:hypothetical protein